MIVYHHMGVDATRHTKIKAVVSFDHRNVPPRATGHRSTGRWGHRPAVLDCPEITRKVEKAAPGELAAVPEAGVHVVR